MSWWFIVYFSSPLSIIYFSFFNDLFIIIKAVIHEIIIIKILQFNNSSLLLPNFIISTIYISNPLIINNISKSILKSDILKIPHHGSKTSTTEKFLEYVNPKIALIGVGKNNFGHPSDVVIERLERKGIKIYRTDLNGEIEIRVDDESKISVKSLIK